MTYAYSKPTAEEKAALYLERAQEKQLYRKVYPLKERGVFRIVGADQSGSYLTSMCPTLGYVEGTFEEVVHYAASLRLFTYWSDTDFGTIEKIDILKLGE